MNFEDAVKLACRESTLDDALTFICVWEAERIVKFVKANPNKPWESMFKYCITTIQAEYAKTEKST